MSHVRLKITASSSYEKDNVDTSEYNHVKVVCNVCGMCGCVCACMFVCMCECMRACACVRSACDM